MGAFGELLILVDFEVGIALRNDSSWIIHSGLSLNRGLKNLSVNEGG